MPNDHGLVVRRSDWQEEGVALLCGIANAGGGSVLVSSASGNHSRKMKHLRKSFETIPRISKQELGITCTTEPIMDGVELCLEIKVPAAESPVRYRNNYYLYANGINTIVTQASLEQRFSKPEGASEQDSFVTANPSDIENEPSSPSQDSQQDRNPSQEDQEKSVARPHGLDRDRSTGSDPNRKPTFKDVSVAAANRLDMTSTDEYILKVLETNGRVTAIRIAEVLGVSESTVRRSFRRLREYGFIERVGSNKAGYWRVVD